MLYHSKIQTHQKGSRCQWEIDTAKSSKQRPFKSTVLDCSGGNREAKTIRPPSGPGRVKAGAGIPMPPYLKAKPSAGLRASRRGCLGVPLHPLQNALLGRKLKHDSSQFLGRNAKSRTSSAPKRPIREEMI